MFNSSSKMAKSNETEGVMRNHLAAGTEVKGDIITQGDIRIDGKVTGSITSKGKLVVGNTGVIEGEVNCVTGNISGSIQGVVVVSEMLKVQATGKLSGEITYGKLSVEPGAELEGKLAISGKVKDISSSGQQQKRAAEKTA
ncbi:MAG: cytoskeletal protein CcmA (bactofilin family) [Salibacteraceae bacterium]|jgi:cytoskeletal protein CcmA (bactofilin family)